MSAQELTILTPDWPAPKGVRAAFTLRQGGVSRPPFHTLNLARHVGDDPSAVAENRRRVREALELPDEPLWLTQVHGAGVLGVEESAAQEAAATEFVPRGDASVSRVPGRVCAIQVADCMPVLLSSRDGSVVAAAHGGWRGLAAGILEETIRVLLAGSADRARPALAAADLIAWMGPAIGAAHFEVGDEVRAAFVATDAGAAHAFARNSRGRWQCDLYALARRRLSALGVREVYGGDWCTFADPARFFSYRRDGQCGRMAALIWIER
jgi:polyphenol oxidase